MITNEDGLLERYKGPLPAESPAIEIDKQAKMLDVKICNMEGPAPITSMFTGRATFMSFEGHSIGPEHTFVFALCS